MDADGGVVLHMDYRAYQSKMVLNAHGAGNNWGSEVRIYNLVYTAGEALILMAKAEEEGWVVYINGEEIGYFQHRLPVTSMKRMLFKATSGSDSELKSLQFFY